jgi:hypothetical protein
MCIMIIRYDCGCENRGEQLCLPYRTLLCKAEADNLKRGFWKKLFCRRPEEVVCKMPPGRQYRLGNCPTCTTQQDVQKEKEYQRMRRRQARDRKQQSRQAETIPQDEVEHWRKNTKWGWICEQCRAEGRTIEYYHRAVVNGPCCARGVNEFEEWEQNQGYRSHRTNPSSRESRANLSRGYPARENHSEQAKINPKPVLAHGIHPSLELPKLDATRAAIDNGWNSGEDMEPHLVADIVNLSGMDLNSHMLPLPPPEPQPYYEDVGINVDQWDRMRRTVHGSYPAPRPPPADPIPVRPLRPSASPGSIDRQVYTTPSFSASQLVPYPEINLQPRRVEGDVGVAIPQNQVSTTPSNIYNTGNHSPARQLRGSSSLRQPRQAPEPAITVKAPSTPLRQPRDALGSATSSALRRHTSAKGRPSQPVASTPSRQSRNTSGPLNLSESSRRPTRPNRSASGPPTSMRHPIADTTNWHYTAVIASGRRISLTSSRGPPVPTAGENNISHTSTPVAHRLRVSSVSSHPVGQARALRTSASIVREMSDGLNREIDDTIDYFVDGTASGQEIMRDGRG